MSLSLYAHRYYFFVNAKAYPIDNSASRNASLKSKFFVIFVVEKEIFFENVYQKQGEQVCLVT